MKRVDLIRLVRSVRSSAVVLSALWCALFPICAGAQSDGKILDDTPLDAAVANALLSAVNNSAAFDLAHIDNRQPTPGGRGSLVWAGSAANVTTSIPTFVVRLSPAASGPGGAEPPAATEIEFLFDDQTITVRPWRPVQREYAGGLRIHRGGRGLRKSAVRVEGGREIAVFAPQLKSAESGVGIIVCLTYLEQRPARDNADDPGDILVVPRRDTFNVVESLVTARGVIDARLTSGVIPGKAEAELFRTHNITPAVQSTDIAVSRDPLIGVTYTAVTPPAFVPERSTGSFGAIRGVVRLETPAGHRQFVERESRVWFERLAEAPTISAGGTDAIPLPILERSPELAEPNPIYGSCFAVVEQVSKTRTFVDAPPPTPEPSEQ